MALGNESVNKAVSEADSHFSNSTGCCRNHTVAVDAIMRIAEGALIVSVLRVLDIGIRPHL